MSVVVAGDGAALQVTESGSGPPLLFLHGWAMSSRVWQRQLEEFSGSFRCIAPDMRGHGGSARGSGPLTWGRLAEDLAETCDALDIRDAVVVAWSMGGELLLEALDLLRPRIAGALLVGVTPRFTASADFPWGLPEDEVRGMSLRLRRAYLKTLEDFFHLMFPEAEVTPDEVRRLAGEVVRGGPLPEKETLLEGLRLLDEGDFRDRLSAIDFPLLLVHGTADPICLPGASRYMHDAVSGSTLLLLEGAGHAPFLTRSSEFNEALRRFALECHGRRS